MSEPHLIATRVVLEHIRELERPSMAINYWHSSYLAQRSYAKTAAYEILELLRNSSEPPLVIIEEYRDKMNELACLKPFTSFMFAVMADTAEHIIDAIMGSCY